MQDREPSCTCTCTCTSTSTCCKLTALHVHLRSDHDVHVNTIGVEGVVVFCKVQAAGLLHLWESQADRIPPLVLRGTGPSSSRIAITKSELLHGVDARGRLQQRGAGLRYELRRSKRSPAAKPKAVRDQRVRRLFRFHASRRACGFYSLSLPFAPWWSPDKSTRTWVCAHTALLPAA